VHFQECTPFFIAMQKIAGKMGANPAGLARVQVRRVKQFAGFLNNKGSR
jgi:hypothetical protein